MQELALFVLFCEFVAELLRQIRMTAGPVQDPAQHLRTGLLVLGKSLAQHRDAAVRLREVREYNLAADVERRRLLGTNQVRRSSHAQQAERKPLELGVRRTAVIEFANSGE